MMDTPAHDSSKSFIDPVAPEQEKDLSYSRERDESPRDETYPPAWGRWLILFTLNLAMLIDVVSGSALFVVVSDTARDIGVAGADLSWM
jgi:hypothetical protein